MASRESMILQLGGSKRGMRREEPLSSKFLDHLFCSVMIREWIIMDTPGDDEANEV